MDKGIWLEAALNGPWGRRAQPLSPVAVADIVADGVACIENGASIIHVHAWDPEAGVQIDCADTYARIIEGIREKVDAIVYPTIASEADRYGVIEQLARRGLLEWAVLDPGSVNIEPLGAQPDAPRFVYINDPQTVGRGFALAAQWGFHPAFAIYEPGFIRAARAWLDRYPACPPPVFRLMFSTEYTFGFPPEDYAFRAWRDMLEDLAPGLPVMVSGLGIDSLALLPQTLDIGAHIRVGLEDMPLGCPLANVALVQRMATAIASQGRRLATTAEVRAAMAGVGAAGVAAKEGRGMPARTDAAFASGVS